MDKQTEKKVELLPFEEAVEKANFDTQLLKFLERTPFFAELSRHIRKVPSRTLPTAGVAYARGTDDITLYWNPEFIAGLTPGEFNGLMTHELYHIILQHIAFRRKKPHRMWNIATDLAINSLIIEEQKKSGAASLALPAGGLVPGQWPTMPGGRAMTEEEKKGRKLAALIATFKPGDFSESYYSLLSAAADEEKRKCPKHGDPADDEGEGIPGGANAGGGQEEGEDSGAGQGEKECTCGEDWADGFDDHDGWDDLSDEERQYVESRVKDMMAKAAKHANQRADGWGNIPAEMREQINAMISNAVDWKIVLRNFVGSVCRANRTSTIKRINRRYPYIHPGVKKNYLPKLLVAIDMSGSVGDEALELFFGELNNLTRMVDITIAPFDTDVNEKDVFEWKKGQKVAAQRTKCGGTDFDGPTRFANDPKNRGKWDGLLILTDGQAPQPAPSRVKRGWVLAPECKLYFESNETQILMTQPKKSK